MKIGFIGLGIMGESMSENIIRKSGKEVIVYDINPDKVKLLVDKGAIGAKSIKEVAEKSDVIISMVPKSEDVKAVYEEMFKVIDDSKILIDMSTIDPSVSIELSKRVAEKGAVMLDAPVVKSKPAAIDGTLGIYVGGDKKTFEKVKDILLCMGSNIIHMGDNGSGLIMKICHNMLVAQIQNGVNEMILLAEKAGIDIDDFITAISYGGGQNFYLDTKGLKIKKRDFTTAFSLENMHKDINIAANLKAELGLKLPGVELVRNIYEKGMKLGYGKEDFSATYKVVSNI